ncbi:AAA family ATPase [Streptomyces sp. NPDC047028]|uniref:helix-turn-helix transcriptional regulator n=1 Tax=Streptomyces sp. NPDC047028 TaxID=3155793 RepID=UPI0033D1F8A1
MDPKLFHGPSNTGERTEEAVLALNHSGFCDGPRIDHFIGRLTELSTLRLAAIQASEGYPQLVYIEGEPGIGKTTLLQKFATELSEFTILKATADRNEDNLPGAVLGQIARAVSGDTLQAYPLSDEGISSTTPFAAGAQLVSLLGCLQEDGPVAIVLDDMQWIDEFSARALTFMMRRFRADQILFIVSLRRDVTGVNTAGFTSYLRKHEGGSGISLKGFHKEEISQLVEAILGKTLPDKSITRLLEQTGGHPLFVRTLLAELPEDGLLCGENLLSASLTAVIRRMLATLPHESRQLLDSLAVLDARVPLSRAALISQISSDSVTQSLIPLLSLGLVEWWPHEPITPIAIRHAVQRDAVYFLIPPERRQRLHAAAVDVVDGTAIWVHRVAATAGPDDELAAQLEAVARNEVQMSRHGLAGTHFLWAADLSLTRQDRERRLLSAALSLLAANQLRQVLRYKERIEASSFSPARDLVLIAVNIFSGRYDEATRLAVRLLDLVRANLKSKELAQDTAYLLPWGLLVGERTSEVVESARWALNSGELDPKAASSTLTILSGAIGVLKGPQAALDCVLEFTQYTVVTNPAHVDGIGARGVWEVLDGKLSSGLKNLQAAMDHSRSGAPITACRRLWAYAAWGQFLKGEWDESVLTAEMAVDEALSGGYTFDYSFEYLAGMFVPAARGQWQQAQQLLEFVEQSAASAGAASGRLISGTARAVIAQTQSDYGAMYDALRPWHDLSLRHIDAAMIERWWRPLLAEAQLGTGRLEEAGVNLAKLTNAMHAPFMRLQVSRLRGWLLMCQGRAREAATTFDQALSEVVPVSDDAPIFRAHVQFQYGKCLYGLGQRRKAGQEFQKAYAIFSALRAIPYLNACEMQLARCGLRSNTSRNKRDLLTEREREIARYIGKGMTNREIADHLYLSPKTVEYHLGNMFTKLAISDRKELRGLIQDGAL